MRIVKFGKIETDENGELVFSGFVLDELCEGETASITILDKVIERMVFEKQRIKVFGPPKDKEVEFKGVE